MSEDPDQVGSRRTESGGGVVTGARGVGPGTKIGARYLLGELLGRGGMGEVWRARQINLDREVALKLLLPSEVESPRQALRRFDREARVASAIKHPNVVEIYDVGEHEGYAYLAMELLHGVSLRDHLDPDAPLEAELVIDIGAALADALVTAHAVGAVHRDLKPENIFLDQSGQIMRVVVLDFGLAFIERGDQHLGRMTRAGVVMGTPDYLSPEQARGGEIGPASDIYSLGCVLYELLAGSPPFTGSQLNVLTQHLYVMPERLSERRGGLSRELEELIMAMLRKRPEERPHAGEIREQLALLAMTLSGRRKRGRDAQFIQNRAERMLSYSPTAPLASAVAESASALASGASALTVAFIGELDEDIELGLLSNEVAVSLWPGADLAARPEGVELVFVADAGARPLLELVAGLVAEGLTVVAAIDSGERQLMGELARAGAAEITTLPLVVDNVVRSLRRAKRRHDRRVRKRQREAES